MTEQGTSNKEIEPLAALLRQGPFAILTGAGLSTASGIPAYRDQSGQWRQSRQPIQHQDFLKSETVRRRYWARSYMGWPTINLATPNPGHRALAELARLGHVTGVITQNVDGLHQKAGSPTVTELHGGLAWVRCLACEARIPRQTVQTWLAEANPGFDPTPLQQAPDGDVHLEDAAYEGFHIAHCPQCAGTLKPDVVFFGDNVPRERVADAMALVSQSAGVLIVGSSLTVYSGFRFADQASRMGIPLVAINRGSTRADPLLDMKIDQDCSAALTSLVARLSA